MLRPVCSSWPPTPTKGAPTAGSGADKSRLGTTTRTDGTTRVTYNTELLHEGSSPTSQRYAIGSLGERAPTWITLCSVHGRKVRVTASA